MQSTTSPKMTPAEYYALCRKAERLGVPVSVDDPASPATVDGLVAAVSEAEAEASATEILKGNWDEGGTISAHLPTDAAVALLFARGWRMVDNGWYSPSGRRFWETDEALQVALVAEVAEQVAR